jgi:hypothetical protein
LLALSLACSTAIAEPLVLISPLRDRTDRLDWILNSAKPPLAVQRVFIEGVPKRADSWRRVLGDARPVDLESARLVVLETAPAAALVRIRTTAGRPLLEMLPGWVKRGGSLLVIGGWPSQETYRGLPLAAVLPATLRRDPGLEAFRKRRRRVLEGAVPPGLHVDHLHPTAGISGKVLIRAGEDPFVVRGEHGDGRVLQVLSGDHEHFHEDGDASRAGAFFASRAWESLVLRFVDEVLGTAHVPGFREVAPDASLPAVRIGAHARPAGWFDQAHPEDRGAITLETSEGNRVLETKLDEERAVRIPADIRAGVYSVRWKTEAGVRSGRLRLGVAADPSRFDIRLSTLGNVPYPYGLAPGEAYERARELADAGVTSVVFHSLSKSPKSDLRALRGIAAAGMWIVYYYTFRHDRSYPDWRYGPVAPGRARDLEGAEIGWDIYDPLFRIGIDRMFDGSSEVLNLPGMLALEMLEEWRDGNMRNASLRAEMKAQGLSGDEQPGEPGWFAHQEIRSRNTGQTLARLRAAGKRALPGVPQAGYWPGSYWKRPDHYTLRVPELAGSVEELLGPGYGYNYSNPDAGWLSVVDSAAEIFGAQNHGREPGKRFSIFALGHPLSDRGAEDFDSSVWRETAWTALAHGAAGLAYWGLPGGEALEPLRQLHQEASRIGPWLRAAPRRPAEVAVLASWTTRTAGSEREVERHADCVGTRFVDLASGVEEVDYLLEEQLEAPPTQLRAIVLTAVPVLTDGATAALVRFVQGGGHLFLEPGSGARDERAVRAYDPWGGIRGTERVHTLARQKICKPGRLSRHRGSDWSRRLREIGIRSRSGTVEPRTEARLLGGGGVYFWVLLNHTSSPASVRASATLDGKVALWRDARSGAKVDVGPGPVVEIERKVPARDAVILMGVERPASILELGLVAHRNRVEVGVEARDARGDPLADGYPLSLSVTGQGGQPILHPGDASRTVHAGSAHWVVPVPLGARASWTFRVQDPLGGVQASRVLKLLQQEAS